MREQQTQYVQLLFAGTTGTEEIRQEILQNTLDRYDDLIAQGKAPEAAYRLAISGIGDVGEIIGSAPVEAAPSQPQVAKAPAAATPVWKRIIQAAAIFLYIICPIPLFILDELGMDVIGLCGTLSIAAVATVMLILSGGEKNAAKAQHNPESELNKALSSAIGILGVIVYLILSFSTGAWWITWLVFPIIGAVNGLVRACIDLKEAAK